MRAPGEGEIRDVQERKHGFGEQPSLTQGLDRKKEEQAALKAERGYGGGGGGGGGVDVQAALGGSGREVVGAEREEGSSYAEGRQGDHTHV